ncbi:MAG: 3-oxoacyl-[acyl-carrier-protein] reductase [Longicatena sp.]
MERKVAFISGASRGIGEAIAITLSHEYDVVINYANNEASALGVLAKCNPNGNHSKFCCNVANSDDVKVMMEEIHKKYGHIDVVVNNAGITKDNLLLRMSEAEFDDVIAINLKGSYNCIRHVARIMMKQRSGKIINMASVVGITGNIGQANYAASKGGIIAMSKAVAKELAPRGICVNAIAPGFIDSEMTQKLSEDVKTTALSSIPMKRFGSVQDVANVVKFLCSEESNYMTGQVLSVDGGMVM